MIKSLSISTDQGLNSIVIIPSLIIICIKNGLKYFLKFQICEIYIIIIKKKDFPYSSHDFFLICKNKISPFKISP